MTEERKDKCEARGKMMNRPKIKKNGEKNYERKRMRTNCWTRKKEIVQNME